MWENKLTVDELNEIFDKLNKMLEEKEKTQNLSYCYFWLR